MTDKANQAICSLYEVTVYDLKRFVDNQREMKKLQEAHFRYTDCVQMDLHLREKLRRRYGMMGIHFPSQFVSPAMVKQLSPLDQMNSAEIRKGLKWWEILEDFLRVAGKSTYAEFTDFLVALGFPEPSSQAIASSIKTHPELFEEKSENGIKVVGLTLWQRLRGITRNVNRKQGPPDQSAPATLNP
jgi:hypothetical protein